MRRAGSALLVLLFAGLAVVGVTFSDGSRAEAVGPEILLPEPTLAPGELAWIMGVTDITAPVLVGGFLAYQLFAPGSWPLTIRGSSHHGQVDAGHTSQSGCTVSSPTVCFTSTPDPAVPVVGTGTWVVAPGTGPTASFWSSKWDCSDGTSHTGNGSPSNASDPNGYAFAASPTCGSANVVYFEVCYQNSGGPCLRGGKVRWFADGLPRSYTATVTCSGGSVVVGSQQPEGSGDTPVSVPACPAGEYAKSVSVDCTIGPETVAGCQSFTTPAGASSGTYADCYTSPGCALAVWYSVNGGSTWTKCAWGGDASCVGWYGSSGTTSYRCQWGAHLLPLSSCSSLAHAYDTSGGYIPANPEGGGPSQTFKNFTVVQVSASNALTENIVPGMDVTVTPVGATAVITIDLWESEYCYFCNKGFTARIRSGGITGPVVASHDFPNPYADSTAGFQAEWAGQYTDKAPPSSGRYVVTVQGTTAASNDVIYAGERLLTVVMPAPDWSSTVAVSNAPSPSPSPTSSTGTGTGTGSSPSPSTGSAGAPASDPSTFGGANAAEDSCWPSGWGWFNPKEWVLHPLRCAFMPSQTDLQAAHDSMSGGWSSTTGLGGWASALGGSVTALGGIASSAGSDCAGPSFTVHLAGIVAPDLRPLYACGPPLDKVAIACKVLLSIGMVLYGLRICTKALRASIGMGDAA
jgi:hypothetical protein